MNHFLSAVATLPGKIILYESSAPNCSICSRSLHCAAFSRLLTLVSLWVRCLLRPRPLTTTTCRPRQPVLWRHLIPLPRLPVLFIPERQESVFERGGSLILGNGSLEAPRKPSGFLLGWPQGTARGVNAQPLCVSDSSCSSNTKGRRVVSTRRRWIDPSVHCVLFARTHADFSET